MRISVIRSPEIVVRISVIRSLEIVVRISVIRSLAMSAQDAQEQPLNAGHVAYDGLLEC